MHADARLLQWDLKHSKVTHATSGVDIRLKTVTNRRF